LLELEHDDDFSVPLSRTRPRGSRPADPYAHLTPSTLLTSAEWLAEQAEKLSAADAQFGRGMAALLREGCRPTTRQIERLVLLTAALIQSS